jgi:hypothetical protein
VHPDRDDTMAQILAAGRELARRDDGSMVNKTAHNRIRTALAVVTGFDNPHRDDETCAGRIESVIGARKQHTPHDAATYIRRAR